MLVRVKKSWYNSALVEAVLAAKEPGTDHALALIVLPNAVHPIHAGENDPAEVEEFVASIARTFNLASDAESDKPFVTDNRDEPSQQTTDDETHSQWFKSGWESLALDLLNDIVSAGDNKVNDLWMWTWFKDHGLGEMVSQVVKAESVVDALMSHKPKTPMGEALTRVADSIESALNQRNVTAVKPSDLPKKPDPERDGPNYEVDAHDEGSEDATPAALVIGRETVNSMVTEIFAKSDGQILAGDLGVHLAEKLGYKVVG